MDMDTLIHYGGGIKNIEESTDGWKFGGYLVVFDSTDVSSLRDRFTKSTDFDIQDGDRRSVYYNHGMDGTVKRTRLGDCRLQVKDAGIWIEGEIKKRSDYLAKHAEQIAMNIKQFGLSSGAPAHLVERKDVTGGHEVTLWPIAEASITPTPAEPMTGCVSLKSLMEPESDEAKSNDDVTTDEITTAPISTPPDGMEFEAHSKSVLAAVGDIQERIEGLTELRCVKSERRWSEAKYDQLTQLADGLASSAEAIKTLAETHAPQSQEPEPEDDTLQIMALNALWNVEVTRARLHGVAV